jgi:DNA-binding MarR family transcriptional regulator
MATDRSHGALAEALYRLAALIVRSTPREMSLTAASTLAILERNGPQRITVLAESQGVTQPSMTSLVTRLESAGLVQRQADLADGRVVLVDLAEGGAGYLAERRRLGGDFVLDLLGQLPEDELDALVAALPAIQRIQDYQSFETAREALA